MCCRYLIAFPVSAFNKYWVLPLDYLILNTCLNFLKFIFHAPFCTTINWTSVIKVLSVSLVWILTKKMKFLTNTLCIETELFCFIGVWEHSVMCWFWPLSQKGIKVILTTAHFGMTNTQVAEDFSHTQTLSHTDMTGTWLWLPDGSLHLNTAHNDSVWHTQITASLVIYLFVFLLCFFLVHICMALGRS